MSLPFDLTAIDWSGLLTPYVLWPLLTVALLAVAHFGLRVLVAIKTSSWSWAKFPNVLRNEGFDLLYSAALGVLADGIPQTGGRVAARVAVVALLAKMAWELYRELSGDCKDFAAAYFGKSAPAGQ